MFGYHCPWYRLHATSAKKAKYGSTTEVLWASFPLIVCSKKGVLHCKYAVYHKWLACRLVSQWQKPLSNIMAWVCIVMWQTLPDLWTWSARWGSHWGWLLIIFHPLPLKNFVFCLSLIIWILRTVYNSVCFSSSQLKLLYSYNILHNFALINVLLIVSKRNCINHNLPNTCSKMHTKRNKQLTYKWALLIRTTRISTCILSVGACVWVHTNTCIYISIYIYIY